MSISTSKIVVGFDGSKESEDAIRWATMVAERRSAEILVVSATGADEARRAVGDPQLAILNERAAYEIAEQGADLARAIRPSRVDAVGVSTNPASALASMSNDAQLVIVGHRGAGALRAGFLGSVAFAVTTHAACPVAVIRGQPRDLPSKHFPSVVGFDGSRNSQIALEQATQWAAESLTPLRVVVAWKPTRRVRGTGDESATHDNAREDAKELARHASDQVGRLAPHVAVEVVVAPGRPSEVLVAAAAEASLLIVGARGRGDFASLLLGSVSREVIENANCAVYVVR